MLFSSTSTSDSLVQTQELVFGVRNTRQSARWQQHLKRPVLLPISEWPRCSLPLLNINIYDMYLGIQPISPRGEKKKGLMYKISVVLIFTSLNASQRAFNPRSNCYPSQSSLPLHLRSSLSTFFPLLSLSQPAACKHGLITVSYLWWCFNNSWPQVSGACAGVARVIHHDLANLSLNCQGHLRLCSGSVGSVNNHNTETYTQTLMRSKSKIKTFMASALILDPSPARHQAGFFYLLPTRQLGVQTRTEMRR